MSVPDYEIFHFGEESLLIQIQQRPSDILLNWLLDCCNIIRSKFNVEVVHTYNEILIKSISNDKLIAIKNKLPELLSSQINSKQSKGVLHRIPVCYETAFAKDIESYTTTLGLTKSEVIHLHTSVTYTVYFMGFLPGFPYLEGLDSRLHLERKATPDRKIVTGSIAIGGSQTGIYPQESPGGWHCIGQTPMSLYETSKQPPTTIKAGDRVIFYEITAKEFESFKNQIVY